jgi:hypothetical protein
MNPFPIFLKFQTVLIRLGVVNNFKLFVKKYIAYHGLHGSHNKLPILL